MGWLSGWAYRRAVTITNNTSTELTDYQVRIELNSSNFDFSKANADGSDIRFTADDGETLIPYWIEKWDSSNEQAVIWVKVPSIPASGSTTIYMYHGNLSAVSESDGEAVFEFFDDFDGAELDTNKWQVLGSITTSVSGGILTITADARGEGIATVDDFDFSNLLIEAKIRYVSGSYHSLGLAWKLSGSSRFYILNEWGTTNEIRILKQTGSETKLATRSGFDYSLNTWYIEQVIVQGDSYTGKVYDESGNELVTLTASDGELAGAKIGLIQYANARETTDIDWIRVRKYAEQEPTASVGSEETLPIPVKIWDGSQWVNVKAVKVWDGSAWVDAKAIYVWDGSSWVKL